MEFIFPDLPFLRVRKMKDKVTAWNVVGLVEMAD